MSNPIAMKAIARCLLSEMRDLTFDYVCAVATSGIPFAAYSCQEGGLRLSYTHNPAGARSWKLVPCLPSGSHLLILDDASGWGRTKLPAVRALIEQGYAVTDILSVSELGVPPTPWYRKRGIKMHSLVDARTVLQRMREMGRISPDIFQLAWSWLDDPDAWYKGSFSAQFVASLRLAESVRASDA